MAQFIGIVDTNEKPKPAGFRRLEDTFYDPYLKGTGEVLRYASEPESTGQYASSYSLGARLVQALSELERLQDDWDTYNAVAPTSKNIELAERICSLFPRKLQPEISPEVDGSIGLYWDLDFIYNINVNAAEYENPKFSIETYDGFILVDEEFESNGLNTEQIASAFREHLTKEMGSQ